jgi:type III secretion protein V
MKVFLSHSSADKDLARRLAVDLRAEHVEVWLDEWEIQVGELFEHEIEQGLAEAQFVLVLLTRASVASDWVNREWRRKIAQETETRQIAVVPVRAERCEIPDFLAQRSHADISGGSYPMGFRHLLTILQHYSDDNSIKVPDDPIDRHESSAEMLPVVAPIGLEVSADLIPLFEPDANGVSRALNELAPRMRESLQARFGFPFPGIRIRGNDTDMPPRSAFIAIEEVPEVLFEVGAEEVLADQDVEALAALGIKAEPRQDRVTGRVRARIAGADRRAAEAAGVDVWDAAEYLFLAVETVVRQTAALFLDIDVARQLVDDIELASPDLVARTVPRIVSWWELTDVLRRLVDEEVGIGDLTSILEALSRREPEESDTSMLAERARHALNRQITETFIRGRSALPVFLLDSEIEDVLAKAIVRTPVGPYLTLEPGVSDDVLAAVRVAVQAAGERADGVPMLVTTGDVRPFVRRLVSLEFPALHVLSRDDLMPDVPIQIEARILLGRTSTPSTPTGQRAER